MMITSRQPETRRRRMRTIAVRVSALLLLTMSAIANASGIEKLLMPGRVIWGHEEVEGDCSACHDAESDLAQASLCVACHEDVGRDRKSLTGYHGLFEAAQTKECVVCHTDHEGRSANIVLREEIFDHDFSDFPLNGAHKAASCTDCHAGGEKHREATSNCGSCHVEDDVHDGALGSDCQGCHDEQSWSTTGFDHDKVGYRLTGGHTAVACVDCHRGNVFEGTPTSCGTCHSIDDVHRGANGSQCHDCHTTATWRNIGFDHFAETGFALTDGHGGLNCEDCHSRDDFKDDLTDACASCHVSEDDHQGRNGRDCQNCHVASGWSNTLFDHADTRFALHGSHASLYCTACHKENTSVELPLSCGSCHQVDDSHGGQMGESCGSCHQETEWNLAIVFDHDLSGFPLVGMHATAPCASCHASNRFKDSPTDCASCHADDDIHRGTLGDDCGACHTSNDWSVAMFDHDTQTDFPLDGAHGGIECSGCHRDSSADMADVPSSCGGCHKTDDVHAGQFGLSCDSCHNSTSFSDVDKL